MSHQKNKMYCAGTCREKKNLAKLTQCKYVIDLDPEWFVKKIKHNTTEIRVWWEKWVTKGLKYAGFVCYHIKLYFFQLFLSVVWWFLIQPSDLDIFKLKREWRRERSILSCLSFNMSFWQWLFWSLGKLQLTSCCWLEGQYVLFNICTLSDFITLVPGLL